MSDPEYANWVDEIGEGNPLKTHYLVDLHMIENVFDSCDAVDYLYPPDILADQETCIWPSFLIPLNVYVSEFNDWILR